MAIIEPRTTSDWAEKVVRHLRELEELCAEFWVKCDGAPEDDWPSLRAEYDARYDVSRNKAWQSLNGFADSAGEWLNRGFLLRDMQPPARASQGPDPAQGT